MSYIFSVWKSHREVFHFYEINILYRWHIRMTKYYFLFLYNHFDVKISIKEKKCIIFTETRSDKTVFYYFSRRLSEHIWTMNTHAVAIILCFVCRRTSAYRYNYIRSSLIRSFAPASHNIMLEIVYINDILL